MTPIMDYEGLERLREGGKGGIFFTPSNTAKQNYIYLQCAGAQTGDAGFVWEQPARRSWLLLYCCRGAGELSYQDRRYTLNAGDGLLVDCRQSGAILSASADILDFIWFSMDGAAFGAYYSQFVAKHKAVFTATDGGTLEQLIHRLASVASLKGSAQSELIASTIIINILTLLVIDNVESTTQRRNMPRYIEGIIERINSGYAGHITLDALAAEFNVSKYHLSREFKKYTGYSPNEYLISVRINRAKELLRRTGYSVGEISQMTGCGDVNHFIQLFKSREKTTPAAFRRHWQDD